MNCPSKDLVWTLGRLPPRLRWRRCRCQLRSRSSERVPNHVRSDCTATVQAGVGDGRVSDDGDVSPDSIADAGSLRKAAATLIDDCVADRPVINVTGCCRGEGRTTVSILLARALAKAGLRVILVDGDFANPDLARTFGSCRRRRVERRLECPGRRGGMLRHSLADGVQHSVAGPDRSIGSSGRGRGTAGVTATTREPLRRDSGRFRYVDRSNRCIGREDLLGAHVVVRDRRQADESARVGHVIAKLLAAGQSVIRVVENFAQPRRI